MFRCRFAPSPTGYLHLANTRVAFFNWIMARHHHGEFILRIDDTDTQRSEERYTHAIMEDLSWLGLQWDHIYHQSQRKHIYDPYIAYLKRTGRLYPCYETAEELQEKRAVCLAEKKPPLYDRQSLYNPSADWHSRLPHWRFLLQEEDTVWEDSIQGTLSFPPRTTSDPILIREDGSLSYMLCSVIDDMVMEISHVIRGGDHISNTVAQIQLFQALQAPYPIFAHLPLMKNSQGEKFSKRSGAVGLADLRAEGLLPISILSFLYQSGQKHPDDADTLDTMIQNFSFDRYNPAGAQMDVDVLLHYQHAHMANITWDGLPFQWKETVQNSELWDCIREANVATLNEAHAWVQRLTDNTWNTSVAGCGYSLESLIWLANYVQQHTNIEWAPLLADTTPFFNNSKKQAAMMLRKVLTGEEKGPKMTDVVRVMPHAVIVARVQAALQELSS